MTIMICKKINTLPRMTLTLTGGPKKTTESTRTQIRHDSNSSATTKLHPLPCKANSHEVEKAI
jgi:heat shock protein HslJ